MGESAGIHDAGLQIAVPSDKYFNRWVILMTYQVAEAFVGLPFSMGLFAEALKDNLGFSQVHVDLVASCGQFGLWQTFLLGLLLSVTKLKYQRYYLPVAAVLLSGGLLYMGMALLSRIPASLGIMCVVWFLANIGTCIFMTASYIFNVKNFPHRDRGKICGFTKGMFGMSSAALACFFSAFFNGSNPEATFSLALSLVVFIVVLLCTIPSNAIPAYHVDYVPERAQGITPSFRLILFWFYGLILLLLAITVCDLAGMSVSFATGMVVLVVILSGYAIPYRYGSVRVLSTLQSEDKIMPLTATLSDPSLFSIQSEDNIMPPTATLSEPSSLSNIVIPEECKDSKVEKIDSKLGAATSDAKQPPSLELPWYASLADRRFWAVFISFFAGAGSGLTLFNNVTAIATSLGIDPQPAFVGLMGLGNATARLVAGVLADILYRHGIPRSSVMFISLSGAAVNNFLLSLGISSYLYIGLLIGAIFFGSLFSTVLGLMADYFGTKDIGINYGMQDIALALSSFAISAALVSAFYKNESGDDCIGQACYGGTFLIVGYMCTFCIPVIFFILLRPDYELMKMQQISTESTNNTIKAETRSDSNSTPNHGIDIDVDNIEMVELQLQQSSSLSKYPQTPPLGNSVDTAKQSIDGAH